MSQACQIFCRSHYSCYVPPMKVFVLPSISIEDISLPFGVFTMIVFETFNGGGYACESLKSSHFRGFLEGNLSQASLNLEVLNG